MRIVFCVAAAALVLGGCAGGSGRGSSVSDELTRSSKGLALSRGGWDDTERGYSKRRSYRRRSSRRRYRLPSTAEKKAIVTAVKAHARKAGVPERTGLAVVRQESAFNRKATGGVGEIGLMQIKCETARSVGYYGSCAGLYDVDTNLKFGMRYLKKALNRGSVGYYNSGIHAKRLPHRARRYAREVNAKEAEMAGL